MIFFIGLLLVIISMEMLLVSIDIRLDKIMKELEIEKKTKKKTKYDKIFLEDRII